MSYSVHKREAGYTDKNGNYVRGTLEIAEDYRKEFIAQVEGLGFSYAESEDAYMTFKKDAQISSLVKINAEFSETGMVQKDCIFDVYFEDNTDRDGILRVISELSPGTNYMAEFGFDDMLAEFNNTKVTVQKETDLGVFALKPIDGFSGVVVSLRTKGE